MGTTNITFDLVIIGMETSVWLALLYAQIAGIDALDKLLKTIDGLPSLLLGVGFFYIFGLVVDRLSGGFFRVFRKILSRKEKKNTETIMLYAREGITEHLYRTRMHIRLMRATVVNTTLSVCFGIVLVSNSSNGLIYTAVIFCLGMSTIIICLSSYIKRNRIYFKTARQLKDENPELIKIYEISVD